MSCNYTKLKTNLRLAVSRLKLMEKKKAELAQKARREIGEHLASGKVERARIRVEHIIREDYLVEAMEIVEMYCDLLLARFGLIQQMKTLDEGLQEAISSLIWVAPRMQTDAQELKIIADCLTAKYGKPYAAACRENGLNTVSPKLMQKMSVQAPPKILVEKYLIEIAKICKVPFEPDPNILREDEVQPAEEAMGTNKSDAPLIDLGNEKPPGNGPPGNGPGFNFGGGGGGGMAMPPYPMPQQPGSNQPLMPNDPPIGFNMSGGAVGGLSASVPSPIPTMGNFEFPADVNSTSRTTASDKQATGSATFPMASNDEHQPESLPPNYDTVMRSEIGKFPPPRTPTDSGRPSPAPRNAPRPNDSFPELPSVPDTLPDIPDDLSPLSGGNSGNNSRADNIDFDDLSRRFEELKKRK